MAARPTSKPSPPIDLRFVPVDPQNVHDLDTLFSRGDPRRCQCAYVRLCNADWNASTTDHNRTVHREAIATASRQGRAAGLIAYHDDSGTPQPVGWVSFDERTSFDRLDKSTMLRAIDDQPVWSIVCFVVAATARRQGVAGRLLQAAVDYARTHGARLLEGYPVDTSAGPATTSAANLWTGTVSLFEGAGFQTVEVRRQHADSRPRPIMRLAVAP